MHMVDAIGYAYFCHLTCYGILKRTINHWTGESSGHAATHLTPMSPSEFDSIQSRSDCPQNPTTTNHSLDEVHT